MENLKKNIDLDLDELLDKHYYRKKEYELHKKNEEEKLNLPKIEYKTKKKGKKKSPSVRSERSPTRDNKLRDDSRDNSQNKSPTRLKDKPMTQMKKKGNPLEQRKKQPKKQFPLDCKWLLIQ